ncbi:DNA-binding death effector domain-containing protein 2 isoform X1 [Struthio camelus]|uniref:DNA-binding death effector domain-containing protein 2 isoform X1 n=1 Tax=Struthio camelus TaxID=8801 RepID=UPI003603BC08
MAEPRRPVISQAWEEDECLEYYGMISLHHLFEVIGSQLTENDVAVLSFLLDETQPGLHPLDPTLWTVAGEDEGSAEPPSPLLESWRRRRRRPCQAEGGWEAAGERHRPRNGVELLLELERRGLCDETNFRHLLQLLRVLTRHDLLPYTTLKRQRTVSPERYTYGPSVAAADRQVDSCLSSASAEPRQEQWETGSTSSKRKRVSRGRTRASTLSRRRGAKLAPAPQPEASTPTKVTCGRCPLARACPQGPSAVGPGQNSLVFLGVVVGGCGTQVFPSDKTAGPGLVCDLLLAMLLLGTALPQRGRGGGGIASPGTPACGTWPLLPPVICWSPGLGASGQEALATRFSVLSGQTLGVPLPGCSLGSFCNRARR